MSDAPSGGTTHDDPSSESYAPENRSGPRGRAPTGDALVEKLLSFGRVLRAVGVPVTPGQSAELVRALSWVDLGSRDQVFRAARSVLVKRKEDLDLFETVFNLFWRHPGQEAVRSGRRPPAARARPPRRGFTIASYAAFRAGDEHEERDLADRAGTFSDEERLQRKRFAAMSAEELEAARRLLRKLDWEVSRRITRRRTPDPAGSEIDLRAVLRESGRLGSLPAYLPRRRRAEKQRPVVLIADISGSMERYSKLVLQFFHTLVRSMSDVETFVFGTRLSRITPQLRLRNVDRALAEATYHVVDWAGGTRIGACLGDFNRTWSRRVLRRGAVVVVVSDGCDRGDPEVLAREMRYLQHRCHRLIWLNPNAGHAEYEPRVAGMAAALPYVDDFLPARDIRSLKAFADALARVRRSGRGARTRRGEAGSHLPRWAGHVDRGSESEKEAVP